MKRLKCTYIFSCFFWLCIATQSSASISDNNAPLFQNKKSCLASPNLCLNQINENIKNVKKYSTQWYRLINLKLLTIWEVRDTKSLKNEIHNYLGLYDAPPVFLTTVYTLHAKMLFSSGDVKQGALYANKSVELIKRVNEVSFDADRYAEIIILYNQLNQYENAMEFIDWINKRIARMGPNHYFPKLQTAIAHTYIMTADYQLALKHYQYALTGFIETKHRLETAEGYHNIARALQEKKDYSQAIPAFKKALVWMNSAVKMGDYSVEAKNYTQLRLIEALQKSGQKIEAQSLLKEINPKEVDDVNLLLFQQLTNHQIENY